MEIETQGLTKRYRRFEKQPGLKGSVKSLFHRRMVEHVAVDRFDLAVEAGEFVGLIGPNGAGKTTLVKMLTGIIPVSAGDLSVLGFVPNRQQDAFKRQIAVVMGQKSQLLFELSAADTFLLFQRLYGIDEAVYRRNLHYFVELFQVERLLDVQVRTLSLGERMKMELIAALLHGPRLLFLDEPTIGLDAVAQRQIRSFLRQVNQDKGTTIVLTSHYMEDIRSLCRRGVVIAGGRKLYDGPLTALFERYQTKRKVSVSFAEESAYLPAGPLEVLERDAHKLCFLVEKTRAQLVLKELLDHCQVSDIAIEEEDIGATVERIYAAGGEE